ncbi:MAG: hypothetical protein Phog2KO_50340 [Phototrophicaceae bacterium]
MPFPSELVREIQIAVNNVLADNALNPQQQTFVAHIHKINDEIAKVVQAIPKTEHAHKRIIPSFGDTFLQQQVALFGYAKLLLESPQSFEGAILSEYQQDQMQIIYQYGQQLYELTEQIQKTAFAERRQQYSAEAENINLADFFTEEAPILRYYLRKKPIQLNIDSEPIQVKVRPYHLSAFIQHIVSIIAEELIESGTINIQTQGNQIEIFCDGIDLNQSEQDTLFKKNGRYAYPQRFIQNGGIIYLETHQEYGASIYLGLSSA